MARAAEQKISIELGSRKEKNGALKFEDVAAEKNRSVLKAKIALLIEAQHCSAKNERVIITIRAKAATFTSATEPSKPVNLRIFLIIICILIIITFYEIIMILAWIAESLLHST